MEGGGCEPVRPLEANCREDMIPEAPEKEFIGINAGEYTAFAGAHPSGC